MNNAFCQNCGAPLSSGAAFCTSCGQPTGAAQPGPASVYTAQPQPTPAYQPAQQYYYPRPVRNTGRIIGIVSAAVVVIAAIVVTLVLVLGAPAVKPEELNGTWEGTFKTERVSPNNSFGLGQDRIGEEEDGEVYISLDENGKGTLIAENTLECSAVYQGGHITGQGGDTRAIFYIEGSLSKDKGSYTLKGTWRITEADTNAEIESGSWTAALD